MSSQACCLLRLDPGDFGLHLFSGLRCQSIYSLQPLCSQLAYKVLNRLVRITEPVFLNQILVNALRALTDFHLGQDQVGQRLALTLSANTFAGGRNGRFRIRAPLDAEGQNGWF
jgi:hypothetical protein